jgi:Ankyrin repeats (3 copies)
MHRSIVEPIASRTERQGFACYVFKGSALFQRFLWEHHMGLFCANFHFRMTDDKALSAALARRKVTQCRVSAAKNGWTSLYEERASQQDDDRIRELATNLSKDLRVPCVAFLVHDSDFACYWLVDDGKLLDEFNSCPGYFDDDDDGSANPSGGQTDVLLPYCRPGVEEKQLEALLREETLFAESVIEGLADALGIDRERALDNYRGSSAPGDDDDSDDDDDGPRGGPNVSPAALADRFAKMYGIKQDSTAADPKAAALVEAAADDDTESIARLLAEGVDIDAEAPGRLPGRHSASEMAQLFPGGAPKVPMTPLLAAVANKRRRATEQLLDAGADPNRVHSLFGTAVHTATGAGEAELLELLLARGGDLNALNAKGMTPLQILAASRATLEKVAQAREMMKSMGVKLPGLADKVANIELPKEGWEACERLLKARNAR